ncbi:hypothetical protein NDU88_010796 [Pleurodeles waltl]|uniref:Uncharacterized protein n=1 Tax=Pleurodeles waltl TaxID=8319 RepID=A0AAV7PYX4_PLEWA|nr:hypothetical protein NDU88_010796 [Pleurodeles waltl]
MAENQVRKHALATECRLYDVEEKANKLLAWLERIERERSWVLIVHWKDGILQTMSAAIAGTFATYYEGLYASHTSMSGPKCADFLNDVPLQQLTEEEREGLEANLTEEELLGAI